MQINGGVRFCEQGMKASIRAMHVQSEVLGMINENVAGFDKVGFQRREPVVSSFTEYIGIHGLSQTVDDQVGRIMVSKSPLDITMANNGYFQIQTPEGVKLTRDGRFQIGKGGELQTLLGEDVLSDNGLKITLPFFPEKLSDIKVNSAGDITVLDRKQNKMVPVATFGIASKTGERAAEVNVVQQHLEASNVDLPTEIMKILPYKRNFEANLQMYNLQSSNLSRVIQQLGS